MSKINKKTKKEIIKLIEKGEAIPEDYRETLFPDKKKEYELIYAGKEREEKILNDTLSVPFQSIKHFGEPKEGEWSNMLIFGDNLQSLKHLLKLKEEGKLKNSDGSNGVKLVYIDPPFATKQDFKASKDQKAYTDKVAGADFLEYLRKRLILIRELLSDDGSLYVHLDFKKAQYVKVLLDEIFGENKFLNEIIWRKRNIPNAQSKYFSQVYDNIYYYSKSDRYTFNKIYLPHTKSQLGPYRLTDKDGRKFRLIMLEARGNQSSPGRKSFEWKGRKAQWLYSKERLDEWFKNDHLYGDPKKGYSKKQYLDETEGVLATNIWVDKGVSPLQGGSNEFIDYPTQKPESLTARIIKASSNPGEIVLDCFAGSGTTGAVAEKLGRKWIMCDCGKLSIYTIQKRMMNLKEEIGNKGTALKHKSYTLYNAGLYYEGEILEKMQNGEYKDFVLELFGCQKRNHKINGVDFHGTLNNHSVMIFNKENYLTYDFIEDLHKNIGSSIKNEAYVIAPVGVVGFNEDYIKKGKNKYTILRIPNSIIDYIRQKDFTKLEQPRTSEDVNQTIDAVGFDFIYPPNMKVKYSIEKQKGKLSEKEYTIEIQEFDPVQLGSKIVEFKDPKSEALSMVMVDVDYDGETFDLDKYYFGDEIAKNKFKVYLGEKIGKQIMIIYIDIFGNEKKEIVKIEEFK